jgi:hypothetical protein
MEKIILVVIIILILPGFILAYDDPNGMNLNAPTNLKIKQTEFRIEHRFYGKLNEEPFDTFFGMFSGANANLGLRYSALPNLEIKASYERDNQEAIIGASYAYFYPNMMFRSQLDAQFFSYKEFNLDILEKERKSNAFILLSLQTDPIIKRIMPIVNVGYDSENKEIGAGVGLYVILLERLGAVRKISLIGEFFPTKLDGNNNCYDFGIRIETYGHNFDFIFGNSSNIGIRRLVLGVDKNRPKGLYFGFNIKRLIG